MANWRDVIGYEGLYRVSDTGLVMSIRRNRLMSLGTSPQGYRTCAISRDGKPRRFMVHRLVLEAFVGPCPDGMETLHRNDIPGDNRIENLRWGTHAENIEDMKRNGNFNSGRWNSTTCRSGIHEWTPRISPVIHRGGRFASSVNLNLGGGTTAIRRRA